ncbi:hypothetical protein DPMN_136872 [Dreissena polymorpha]|uniref:Uncharacterized protein n=1 Tax=Dreissena polymorpha TaxID=45954 RepID=A0A9D4G1K0_DREPO|nr:hypothetical protein DPMN_136872 [Dreissena polymorpha]
MMAYTTYKYTKKDNTYNTIQQLSPFCPQDDNPVVLHANMPAIVILKAERKEQQQEEISA